MDRFDDDTLFAELRELRPTPRPEFAAELDARAAAGFPRGADTTASVVAPIVDWWRGMNPTRRLVPILGVALVAVVMATVAVGISQSGGGGSSLQVEHDGRTLSEFTPMPSDSDRAESEAAAGAAESAESRAAGGGEAAAEEEAESSAAESGAAIEAEATPEAVQGPAVESKAPAQGGRDIERSSYIVLGTKPGEVSGAAAKVYEAVRAAGGFVLSSSVQSGTAGATGASFELSIPSAKAGSALAAISAIAEVRQRHDATNDITAPTISAAEELADSNAAIEGLLKQLGEVETEAEQE